MNKKKKVVNRSCYPDEAIERLARCFYPAILEYYNSEEGQLAFAAWQAEQSGHSAKEKQDGPAGERPALHSRQLFSDRARPSGRALFIFNQKDSTAYLANSSSIVTQKARHSSMEMPRHT